MAPTTTCTSSFSTEAYTITTAITTTTRCTTQPLQTKKSPREVEEKHRIPYIDEIAVEVWLYYGSLENEVFQTLLK